MESDRARICELIVGLGDVEVLRVGGEAARPLAVRVRTRRWPQCRGLRRGGVV